MAVGVGVDDDEYGGTLGRLVHLAGRLLLARATAHTLLHAHRMDTFRFVWFSFGLFLPPGLSPLFIALIYQNKKREKKVFCCSTVTPLRPPNSSYFLRPRG